MTPKRLKDIRWDLPTYDLEGTILRQPRIQIVNVIYNTETLTALVEVVFQELQGTAAFKHARSFPYTLTDDSQESISAENIEQFISVVFPDAVQVEPTK